MNRLGDSEEPGKVELSSMEPYGDELDDVELAAETREEQWVNATGNYPPTLQLETMSLVPEQKENTDIVPSITVTAPADLGEGCQLDTMMEGVTVTVIVPAGGVRRGQKFSVPAPSQTIRVVSPADVRGGGDVDVVVGGRVVTVKAPLNGLRRGESFDIEAPNDNYESHQSSSGQWKDARMDCLRLGFFHPSLWMSCCCPLLAMGQVLTRLKLNWMGKPAASTRSSAFVVLVFVSLAVMKLDFIFSMMQMSLQISKFEDSETRVAYTPPEGEVEDGTDVAIAMVKQIRDVVFIGWTFFWVVVLYNVRKFLRSRDGIRESWVSDCFLLCLCPTLSTAQVMRHTADYQQHKGDYFTLDGLAKEGALQSPRSMIV